LPSPAEIEEAVVQGLEDKGALADIVDIYDTIWSTETPVTRRTAPAQPCSGNGVKACKMGNRERETLLRTARALREEASKLEALAGVSSGWTADSIPCAVPSVAEPLGESAADASSASHPSPQQIEEDVALLSEDVRQMLVPSLVRRYYATTAEAAREKGLSPTYMGRLVREGKLPGFKLGREILAVRQALCRFVPSGPGKPIRLS